MVCNMIICHIAQCTQLGVVDKQKIKFNKQSKTKKIYFATIDGPNNIFNLAFTFSARLYILHTYHSNSEKERPNGFLLLERLIDVRHGVKTFPDPDPITE